MNTDQFNQFFKQLCLGLDPAQQGLDGSVPAGQFSLPPIETVSELVADQTATLPVETIQGVLHQGLKGIVAGASKARKTWTLLDIASSVAAGTDWLVFKTTKGPVLYVNLEIPRAFLQDRLKKLLKAKGLPPISDLHIWNLRGKVKDLATLIAAIISEAKKTPYVLIVIDPIYKLMAGLDENSAGDISNLCNQLEFICEQTGAALLYATHFSKGNQAAKAVIDRISGSGVFGRDADSMVNFTAHKIENCYTVEMVLRNLPEQEPFVVEWKHPKMMVREDLDPEDLKQKNQKAGREVTLDEVLDLVPDGEQLPITKEQLLKSCAENGIGEARAKGLIKALLDQNRISKWKYRRSGTRPAIAYHRKPQDGQDGGSL